MPTYFLITSLAFTICLFWLVKRADRRQIPRNHALDAAVVLMVTGFVGARLFHVFFEEPAYYFEDWSRIFDIWRGGFVWYGGALLGSLCSVAFLAFTRRPIAPLLDLFAPVSALGYSLGRLACLFVGCCYGSTFEAFGHIIRHPTQAYAVLWEAGVLVFLLTLERRATVRNRPGVLFFIWLTLHGFGRLMMEALRADPRGPELGDLSISSWVSLALIVSAMTCVYRLSRSSAFKK